MSKTFFSKIKPLLKQEYDGRYLGIVLEMLCQYDPAPLRNLLEEVFPSIKKLPKNITVIREVKVDNSGSRADLSVQLDGGRKVVIEIKYYDDLLRDEESPKADQLKRYLRRCRAMDWYFLLLTRRPPFEDELKLIEDYEQGDHKYLGALGPHLAKSKHPLAALVLDYFRDLGIVMNEINIDMLYRFFHRFLNPGTKSGRINSREFLKDGPKSFLDLLTNMTLIAEEMTPEFLKARGKERRSGATIDFYFQPFYSAKGLSKFIRERDGNAAREGQLELEEKDRAGGRAYIFASNYLDDASSSFGWLQIEYGFVFIVEPDRNHRLDIKQWAQIYGREIPETVEICRYGLLKNELLKNSDSKKDVLLKGFRKVIAKTLRDAIQNEHVSKSRHKIIHKVLDHLGRS